MKNMNLVQKLGVGIGLSVLTAFGLANMDAQDRKLRQEQHYLEFKGVYEQIDMSRLSDEQRKDVNELKSYTASEVEKDEIPEKAVRLVYMQKLIYEGKAKSFKEAKKIADKTDFNRIYESLNDRDRVMIDSYIRGSPLLIGK